jgi:ketosteroid isomerase-like protein
MIQSREFPCSVGFHLAVILMLSMAAISTRGQDNMAADTVKAREIAFAKTMADRDVVAFATFISEEAIFFSGNNPLRGREAVIKAWSGFYESADAPFSWRPDTVEVLESGSLALSSGPVLSASGEEIGRYNSIWRKDPDGEWRVVFDKGS